MISRCLFITSSYSRRCLRISKLWFSTRKHLLEYDDEVLADLEVVVLDALLGGGDGARHELVLDRLALLHAQALHDPLDALAAEDAQQVVLEREVEVRRAGVALAPGAAAQLVVDAARLVTLGADDVQAAQLHDLLVLGLGDPPRLGHGGPAV